MCSHLLYALFLCLINKFPIYALMHTRFRQKLLTEYRPREQLLTPTKCQLLMDIHNKPSKGSILFTHFRTQTNSFRSYITCKNQTPFFCLYLYRSGSVPGLSDCVRSMINTGFFSGELNQSLERESSVVKCSVLPSLFFSLLLSCLLQSPSLTFAFRLLGLNQF